MRMPRRVEEHIRKARESCLSAVAAYNDPVREFKTGTYIVLMVIAWTSLFHAIYYRRREKPWVVASGTGKGTRYERVRSDYRHWNLATCMGRYYGADNPPTRDNLRFLIGLRDQIEHRHMPELDHVVFGECQSALFNFEEVLVAEFGLERAVNASLTFSLQFSRWLPDARLDAMQQLRRSAAPSVANYVRDFREELTIESANSQQFAFKVFMLPQLANHRARNTLAVEWVQFDAGDPETMRDYDRAIVLIKERDVQTRNRGRLLPGGVAQAVADRIPWRFGVNEHTQSWRHFRVRPASNVHDPTACDVAFCQWDEVFQRYVYTNAWVDRLSEELADAASFRAVVGKAALPKPHQ